MAENRAFLKCQLGTRSAVLCGLGTPSEFFVSKHERERGRDRLWPLRVDSTWATPIIRKEIMR
jgi:hypothetical protein